MNSSNLATADKASPGPDLKVFTPPAASQADGPQDGKGQTLWLLDQLGLRQPRGVCQRGRRMQLQSRRDDRKRAALALSCRCWNCRVCADRLRRDAGLHYAERILGVAGQLYVSRSRPGRWPADLKALQRARASWVRIKEPDGASVVIGTTPLGDGADAVSPAEAVRKLGFEVRAIRRPDGVKRYVPISSSADWPPPPRVPSAWKSRGRLRPGRRRRGGGDFGPPRHRRRSPEDRRRGRPLGRLLRNAGRLDGGEKGRPRRRNVPASLFRFFCLNTD